MSTTDSSPRGRVSSTHIHQSARLTALKSMANSRMASEAGQICGKRRWCERSRSVATSQADDETDCDDDTTEDYVHVEETEHLRIGDTDALTSFYCYSFELMQQLAMKALVKAWIKEIEPKKQRNFPYAKKNEKTPAWWPIDKVNHKEPDHLRKEERHHLAIEILRYVHNDAKFGTDGIQRLQKASGKINLKFEHEPEAKFEQRMALLSQLYIVAEKEGCVHRGEMDNDDVVSITKYTKLTKVQRAGTVGVKRARKAPRLDGTPPITPVGNPSLPNADPLEESVPLERLHEVQSQRSFTSSADLPANSLSFTPTIVQSQTSDPESETKRIMPPRMPGSAPPMPLNDQNSAPQRFPFDRSTGSISWEHPAPMDSDTSMLQAMDSSSFSSTGNTALSSHGFQDYQISPNLGQMVMPHGLPHPLPGYPMGYAHMHHQRQPAVFQAMVPGHHWSSTPGSWELPLDTQFEM
ncbi:hypothetical protein EJ06DRAFT_206628 [Trichodelitschia bisporula]|uniref:Subtelomeric hrmA-associated cluster protein AFUB-079030/YDR124W-like helical bundle domain-containing protein n=1 Tax=Trichodelitschia bisporula TaxID=703511 RepID=A0A6G1I8X4_9PEZI|nr:hypothetical protein EJ06DRAFT_206628 [Trichodelitschia bisporula]